MRTLQLKVRKLGDEKAKGLAGNFLTEEHFDHLVDDDCRVLRPDGSTLMVYVRNAVPDKLCASAYPVMLRATKDHGDMSNRGTATGSNYGSKEIRPDGTLSNTSHIRPSQHPELRRTGSAIIGYYDRYVRFPYCRQTAFLIHQGERFKKAIPFIRHVGEVFKENEPVRYAAQMEKIEQTHPDFVIHGTPFTTVTVNRNYQTATHQDAGDLKVGFGVLTVMSAGKYRGGYFVVPKWGVACDMKDGGVMLCDVHEWHGNTEIKGVKGAYERVSCVFYYRENMAECGSAAEELERAKRRKRGDPVHG